MDEQKMITPECQETIQPDLEVLRKVYGRRKINKKCVLILSYLLIIATTIGTSTKQDAKFVVGNETKVEVKSDVVISSDAMIESDAKPRDVVTKPTKAIVQRLKTIVKESPDKAIPSDSQTIETVNLGQFKISAYCHCSQCCGKSDGITATGTLVQANRTIAVDPRVIPLGSKVMIDGQIYVAEDTGGAIKGNRIDMYFATHQEALNFGIQYKNVSLITIA